MRNIIITIVLVLSWLFTTNYHSNAFALADWWQRPEVRPTQPSEERNLPPPVQPTNPPSQPTVAPTNPPTGGTPSDGGGGGGSSSGDGGNPCDPGKSYVGPYCGWSPDTTTSGGGGGGGESRVGGPQILGLSNTSSSDVYLSDIMILAGILCLALYAKSKIITDKPH